MVLRADSTKNTGVMQEAWALVEQVSRSQWETKAFDVDVKWVQALTDGDQSLSGLLNRRIGDHRYVHVRGCVRKSDNSEILYVRASGQRRVHIFEKIKARVICLQKSLKSSSMLKPYTQIKLALSANPISSAVPHLMTRSKEQERNICVPQNAGHSCPSNSLPQVKRHKQMGTINEVSPCYSLSLSLGYSKDLDGWRLTKKTVTYRDRILLFLSTGSRGLHGKSQISFWVHK